MQTPHKGRCAGQVTGTSQHANGFVKGISYALRPGDLPFSAAASERALSLLCTAEGDPGFAAPDRPAGGRIPPAAGSVPTGAMDGDGDPAGPVAATCGATRCISLPMPLAADSPARPLDLAIAWDWNWCSGFSSSCTFSAATMGLWSTAPGEGAPALDANEFTRIHSGKNTNAMASRNAMPAPTILRATARTVRSSRSSCACSPTSRLAVLKSPSEK